jgi:TRAP-type C4-dicarboxylate transport system permease small subunit
MSHGLATPGHVAGPVPRPLVPLARALAAVNRVVVFLSMIALVLAALVLTYSVFSRYFFKAATDWQDELAVFLLVGATFMCGAYVQSYRGHVGIEAIASVLPDSFNHWRMLVVDVLTCLFCAFFAWKSWTLFHEAWVDHQTTSSSWAPPLTIPYGLMATGMTLLALQSLLQTLTRLSGVERHR